MAVAVTMAVPVAAAVAVSVAVAVAEAVAVGFIGFGASSRRYLTRGLFPERHFLACELTSFPHASQLVFR